MNSYQLLNREFRLTTRKSSRQTHVCRKEVDLLTLQLGKINWVELLYMKGALHAPDLPALIQRAFRVPVDTTY